jgi:hypothetical protein
MLPFQALKLLTPTGSGGERLAGQEHSICAKVNGVMHDPGVADAANKKL